VPTFEEETTKVDKLTELKPKMAAKIAP